MIYIKSFRTWIFLIYLIFIIYMSMNSSISIKLFPNLWKYDKVVHFCEYFLLGILLLNALKIRILSNKKWIYSIIFLILFPIIDESLQYFTPYRVSDINDAIADIFGGLLGAYLRKKI